MALLPDYAGLILIYEKNVTSEYLTGIWHSIYVISFNVSNRVLMSQVWISLQ